MSTAEPVLTPYELIEQVRREHNGVFRVDLYFSHDGDNVCKFSDYDRQLALGESSTSMTQAIARCYDHWLGTRNAPAGPTPEETLASQSSLPLDSNHITIPRPPPSNTQRVDYAFHLIQGCNTVSTLSLDEMQAIVNRALAKEFDDDIEQRIHVDRGSSRGQPIPPEH
jgi:hypothetical protein